jgi:Domain of unknown function (DUF4261)
MPKGLISQTVVILFRRETGIEELKPFLSEYVVVKEIPVAKQWELGGPTLIVEFSPEVNGLAAVDVVNRPWPDDMGDPTTNATLFGAWSMGWFGPFTFPNNLQRAVQQAWRWPEAQETVPQHSSFVRIRMSYIFGAGKDAKCLPKDYKPLPELNFVTALASTLLRHPAALCYFNPSGEVVLTKALLDEAILSANSQNIPALDVWTNVRLFNFDSNWLLTDTLGNWQLDIPDHEMAFPKGMCTPTEASRWLRNTVLYLAKNGRVIKNGDTMDDLGNVRWQAKTFSKGIYSPPREVLRWLPLGIQNVPPIFLAEKKGH